MKKLKIIIDDQLVNFSSIKYNDNNYKKLHKDQIVLFNCIF
jgi:hypothetical protein